MRSGDLEEINSAMLDLAQRRVEILREQLQVAEDFLDSLGGASVPSIPVGARRRGPKPGAAKASPAAKPAAVVSVPSSGGGARKTKKRRRMSSEDVRTRLIDTIRAAGPEGISLKEVSDNSGVNYQTAAKVLKESPELFSKDGELKQARWTLRK